MAVQTDVRNLIELNYKIESESAWGCFQCGLPIEGAVAIVCDTCIEKYSDNIEDEIKFLMDGREKRISVPRSRSVSFMNTICLVIMNSIEW